MAETSVIMPVALPLSRNALSPPMGSADLVQLPRELSTFKRTPAILPSRVTLKETVSGPVTSVSLAKDPEDESTTVRDPHILPTCFSSRHPILYLPPLLSSLPAGIAHPDYYPSLPAFSSPTSPPPLSTAARLPSIDDASLSLHRALHNFRPITTEYATVHYPEAFNWDELELPENEEREWYCVAFRSKRRDGSDGGPLYEADKKAHEEAVQNGGLILYWYGTPHPESGLNLATCIWQSRAHAAAANSRPHHIRAMKLAAASYERYELERYRLQKLEGERQLRVVAYDGGDVGW